MINKRMIHCSPVGVIGILAMSFVLAPDLLQDVPAERCVSTLAVMYSVKYFSRGKAMVTVFVMLGAIIQLWKDISDASDGRSRIYPLVYRHCLYRGVSMAICSF